MPRYVFPGWCSTAPQALDAEIEKLLFTPAAPLTGAAITATVALGVAGNVDPGLLQARFRLSNLALDVGNPLSAVVVATFTAGIWQAV